MLARELALVLAGQLQSRGPLSVMALWARSSCSRWYSSCWVCASRWALVCSSSVCCTSIWACDSCRMRLCCSSSSLLTRSSSLLGLQLFGLALRLLQQVLQAVAVHAGADGHQGQPEARSIRSALGLGHRAVEAEFDDGKHFCRSPWRAPAAARRRLAWWRTTPSGSPRAIAHMHHRATGRPGRPALRPQAGLGQPLRGRA